MIPILRQCWNAVDSAFDRKTLRQELRLSHYLAQSEPVTVVQAFEPVLQEAQEFDKRACLKMIVGHNVNPDGTAPHWEFFFDLPACCAKLNCEWQLIWDERADDFASAILTVTVIPFLSTTGMYQRLLAEGKLLRRQVIALWREELQKKPDLPLVFKDSDVVLAELMQQGLDPTIEEFSFSTSHEADGQAKWVALTRDDRMYTTSIA